MLLLFNFHFVLDDLWKPLLSEQSYTFLDEAPEVPGGELSPEVAREILTN
jgi:hypothetical protein